MISTEYSTKFNDVLVESMTVVYSQPPDSNSPQDEYQYLTISTDNSGGGLYMNIQTEKWSIDNISEITKILEDFQSRLNIKTE